MKKTLLAIACGMAFNALAQEDSDSAYVLDEVVVTASRTPMAMSDLMSDVTVIRGEAIRKAGAKSLTELLQNQPGIEVASQGGLGSQSGLFIRGANANHTLVLLDGMRINSATVGLTALEHIPLSQIERIEILRGPASSLYGADAIGGVVQVFTRGGMAGAGPSLEAGTGSFGTYRLAGGHTYADEANRVSVFVGKTASDGFDATKTGTWGHNPDDDGYRNNNASLRYEHAFNADHRLEFNSFIADTRTEIDKGPEDGDDQKQRLSSLALGSHNRFLPTWQSTLQLGESRDKLHDLSDDTRFETRQRLFMWQNDLTLPLGSLLLAVERTEQDVTSTTDYTVDERDINAALIGYHLIQGKHSLQVNLRHDDESQFGGHTTGSAAYGYRLTPDWQASLSTGTSFKTPTFNDLYWPVDPYYQGNPDLEPEEARNWELGIKWQRGQDSFSAHYFYNRIDNLITYVYPSMENVHEARIEGFSMHARTVAGNWHISASLDLQSPEDADTGKLLPRRAREHGSLKISRPMGNWDIRAELIASGSRYDDLANTLKLDAYTLFNLGTDYRLNKTTLISARLNNVFDEQYELAGGYNTPDRNFFIGLNYQPR
jgi:vitamin B12 transporter